MFSNMQAHCTKMHRTALPHLQKVILQRKEKKRKDKIRKKINVVHVKIKSVIFKYICVGLLRIYVVKYAIKKK
jgi:hypothetical protein